MSKCKNCKVSLRKKYKKGISGVSGYSETGMQMLTLGAGFLAAKFIRPQLDKIAFVQSNPKIGDAIITGLGLVGAEMTKESNLKSVMIGAATSGAVDLVSSFMPAVGFISSYAPVVAVGGGQTFTPPAAIESVVTSA